MGKISLRYGLIFIVTSFGLLQPGSSFLPGSEPIKRPEPRSPAECEGYPVHLTFDDGPTIYTPEVLKVLEEEKVTATFFLAGAAVQRAPATARSIIRRQIEKGHQIAYHGYEHGDYSRDSRFLNEQIGLTRTKLANFELNSSQTVSDFAAPLFRLPGGSGWTSSIHRSSVGDVRADMIRSRLREEGWTHFGWHVDSLDHRGRSGRGIAETIEKLTRNRGGVVLLHDTSPSSARYTSQLIKKLKENGFCFTGPEHFIMDEALQIRLRGESENCGWKVN